MIYLRLICVFYLNVRKVIFFCPGCIDGCLCDDFRGVNVGVVCVFVDPLIALSVSLYFICPYFGLENLHKVNSNC